MSDFVNRVKRKLGRSTTSIAELWFKDISLGENSVVVEIGAYSGNISLYAVREFSVRQAFAIEASQENFELLCKNCRNTPIVPLNIAIAEKNGVLSFFKYADRPTSNSLLASNPRYSPDEILPDTNRKSRAKRVEVKALTMLSLLEQLKIETVDLLLMNCEGAEVYILPQILENQELINRICQISIEFHPQLLGQKHIMRMIMQTARYYEPRIVTRSIRGPINVIFSRRESPTAIGLNLKIQYIFSWYMDTVWPLFKLVKRYKDRLTR